MNKVILTYKNGGMIDSRGGMQPGLIPALLDLQNAGYSFIMLAPLETAEPGGTENSLSAASLPTDVLQQILGSQGVQSVKTCSISRADTGSAAKSVAADLLPLLVDHAIDRDEAWVVGRENDASPLATQIGFKHFLLEEDAKVGGWSEFAARVCGKPRTSAVERRSNETLITISIDLDSTNRQISIDTGIGFFDHMLEQVAKHGGFSLQMQCKGDLHIDEHHTVEDCGLALGQALREALGDKRGIGRYGFVLPMDETEVQVSMDLSARPYFVFNGNFTREHVGELTTEMVPHFFKSLSDTLGASLHITMKGDNAHHQVEAIFKGVGRTLKQAIQKEGHELPTTKGML